MAVIIQQVQSSTSAPDATQKQNSRNRHRRSRRPGTNRANSDDSLSSYGSVSSSSETSFGSNCTSATMPSSSSVAAPPPLKRSKGRRRHGISIKSGVSLAHPDKYLAMDCEMVGVGESGTESALARVTLVDWKFEIVYDSFCQPAHPVTDYRTFVSGVTAAHLEGAPDAAVCRATVQSLLKGKILVGHALKNDLHALNLTHPWQDTRDTAKYEPFMKVRGVPSEDNTILWPRKLKDLVHEKLQLQIQPYGQAHSPYVDAVSALQLYQHARIKWEKVMTYKIAKTASLQVEQQQLQQFHQSQRPQEPQKSPYYASSSPPQSPTSTATLPTTPSTPPALFLSSTPAVAAGVVECAWPELRSSSSRTTTFKPTSSSSWPRSAPTWGVGKPSQSL